MNAQHLRPGKRHRGCHGLAIGIPRSRDEGRQHMAGTALLCCGNHSVQRALIRGIVEKHTTCTIDLQVDKARRDNIKMRVCWFSSLLRRYNTGNDATCDLNQTVGQWRNAVARKQTACTDQLPLTRRLTRSLDVGCHRSHRSCPVPATRDALNRYARCLADGQFGLK